MGGVTCQIMGSMNTGPRQELQGPTIVLEKRRLKEDQTGEVTCLGAYTATS